MLWIYLIYIMLNIKVQISSKRLSDFPKFICSFTGCLAPFFNFPSFTFFCSGEDRGKCFSFEPESLAGYTDSLSYLELLNSINRTPWILLLVPLCSTVYLCKLPVKWQWTIRLTLLALFGNKHSLSNVWLFSFALVMALILPF